MIFAGQPRVEAAHYVRCSSATKRRARLRRAMAPRADARRVTMLRSLTRVGEGTERQAPRRPSRCTAPEARRAQDGELPYRAEPARLTSEAPYATRGEGGGERHPPPFCTIASVGKWHRESVIVGAALACGWFWKLVSCHEIIIALRDERRALIEHRS